MILFGVGLSVLVVTVVGLVVARRVDGDSRNYFVAGRSLGLPLVAVSLTAAAVDSNATVGNTDLSATAGFWAGASLPLGLALCLLLAGLFIARPMNAMGLMTLGDWFVIRYGRRVELTASLIMIIAYGVLLAGNLVACGYLLETFAHIPYVWGIGLSAALVLLYTAAGGLFSDAYTALLQTVLTVTAAVALLVWVGFTYGLTAPAGMGPGDLGQLTDPAQGAPVNWATFAALGVGDLVAIDFMQRILGARTPGTARRACFVGAGLTATVGVIFALVALTASARLGLTTERGPVLYQLLGQYAPPLLAVAVLSGVVAASFSTASGAILATAGLTVRNVAGFRHPLVRDGKDRLLVWTRRAMVPITTIGVLLAARVAETGVLLTLAFDLMLACLAGPFLLGLVWRRPGPAAAAACMVVGGLTRLVLLALTPTLYGQPNTLLHVPNPWGSQAWDGWVTLVAAAAGLASYALVAALRPRANTCLEREHSVRDDLCETRIVTAA